MTKTATISAMILAQVEKGLTVREAIDAVLGAGTFERIAGEVWEAAQ